MSHLVTASMQKLGRKEDKASHTRDTSHTSMHINTGLPRQRQHVCHLAKAWGQCTGKTCTAKLVRMGFADERQALR